MEREYLIDTNVIIDYLTNKLPPSNLEYLDNRKIRISVISKIELLSWPNATEDYLKIVHRLIELSDVYALDEMVTNKTIEVRRKLKIKLPDAIIASTCLVHGYELITHNIHDFNKIEGLKVIDSHAELNH